MSIKEDVKFKPNTDLNKIRTPADLALHKKNMEIIARVHQKLIAAVEKKNADK